LRPGDGNDAIFPDCFVASAAQVMSAGTRLPLIGMVARAATLASTIVEWNGDSWKMAGKEQFQSRKLRKR